MYKRLLASLLLLTPLSAHAGRRPFIWTYDTELVPLRRVELEQWVWERNKPDAGLSSVWWSPVIGLSDHIELAMPIEWYWQEGQGTQFSTWGGDLRIRLANPDPTMAGPIVPLLRLGIKRRIGDKENPLQIEANAVSSIDINDWLHGAIDIGTHTVPNGHQLSLSYSAGLSAALPVQTDLHIGAEFFGESYLISDEEIPVVAMVGPNASLTWGRTWITAGGLIGLSEGAAPFMPRLIWAVSL